MKKIMMFFAAAAMLTACDSELEYTKPDNITDEIMFSIGDVNANGMNAVSRAGEHNHIAWNADIHADNLGVFGYCNGDIAKVIFNNQKVGYNSTSEKWEYTPQRYWPDFTQYDSFDFFGYMVEETTLPAATVTKDGSDYTLSFPADLTEPILSSANDQPLICHAPQHMTMKEVGKEIPFQMDQVLTGYKIQFQLGEKMDALRYFVITSVKIYGNNMPYGGTVSRTYTLTDGKWSAGAVTWSGLTTKPITPEEPYEVAWDGATDEQRKVNTHTEWVKWGGEGLADGAFYVISHDFHPTIEVTYDVYTDIDGNGDGVYSLDRKDVKSTIILNSTNFSTLVNGTTGEINPIRIKIVPDFLYVLSDDDQTTGFLVDKP